MAIYDSLVKHGFAYRKFKGEIGLEIETETKKKYELEKMTFWDVKADGSLRDIGKEFVFKQPYTFKNEVDLALEEFKEKTKNVPFIQDSITTSVHVHLNFLNESWQTLANFLIVYSLVENFLIRFSGEDRKGNMFCLPISDAEETYTNIIYFLKSLNKKNYGAISFSPDKVKYAALNLAAFTQFGSLEQRSFRGETDTKEIKKWISLLYSLLEYSRQNITPLDIFEGYKKRDRKLLDDIFGDTRKYVKFDEEIERSMIENNFWYTAQIACIPGVNWDNFKEITKKRKMSASDLESLSAKLYGKLWEQCSDVEQQNILSYFNKHGTEVKATPIKSKKLVFNKYMVADVVNHAPDWAGLIQPDLPPNAFNELPPEAMPQENEPGVVFVDNGDDEGDNF